MRNDKVFRRFIVVSKKIFVFFMFCIILWLCCFNAFAESVTYELSNVGLTVDISDNIVYVSSSVKKNDELFKNNTFDYIETMAKIREDNALIYGRDSDNTYEIEIICVENSNHIKNLTNLLSLYILLRMLKIVRIVVLGA